MAEEGEEGSGPWEGDGMLGRRLWKMAGRREKGPAGSYSARRGNAEQARGQRGMGVWGCLRVRGEG